MKKCFFLLAITIFLYARPSFGQKFGYIDTEFIMSQMPSYTIAQKEADNLSAAWQKEIESMQSEVEKMEDNFQAEEILLTEEMKKKRLNEIAEKERELREYQNKIFGYNGTFFKKREDLIKPVLTEIAEASEKVAKQKQLQFILNNSGSIDIIYMNPTHDYTEFVLEELGLVKADQNTPAPQPASTDFDTPDDLPVTEPEEEMSPQQEQNPPATRKSGIPAARKPATAAKQKN